MENIEPMAKKIEVEEVRTGPKKKDPSDKAAGITIYSTFREVAEFGGGKGKTYQMALAEARSFCLAAFKKELEKRRNQK